MNRIIAAFDAMKKQIESRIATGVTTKEKVAATGKLLDMELDEYVRSQELKSLAVANGTISVDEGQTVYAALGNTPQTFNEQPVKSVLTSLFKQLLERKMSHGKA